MEDTDEVLQISPDRKIDTSVFFKEIKYSMDFVLCIDTIRSMRQFLDSAKKASPARLNIQTRKTLQFCEKSIPGAFEYTGTKKCCRSAKKASAVRLCI